MSTLSSAFPVAGVHEIVQVRPEMLEEIKERVHEGRWK